MKIEPSNRQCRVTCRRARRPRRRGFVLTTIIIFILPLLLMAGMALMQLSLIRTSQMRLQAAAEEAARVACQLPPDIQNINDAAGLVLNPLAGDFRTQVDYYDTNGSGTVNSGDRVVIGVTIPMGATSTNYLGWMCGANVNNVRLRTVVTKTIP